MGTRSITSRAVPEFEMATTTSPRVTMPTSPWKPSAGCRKLAGVPVDTMVLAILRPIWPDLPMPQRMTRPVQAITASTAASKASAIRGQRAMSCSSAARSFRTTSKPMSCGVEGMDKS